MMQKYGILNAAESWFGMLRVQFTRALNSPYLVPVPLQHETLNGYKVLGGNCSMVPSVP